LSSSFTVVDPSVMAVQAPVSRVCSPACGALGRERAVGVTVHLG